MNGLGETGRLRGEIAAFLDTWDRCWPQASDANDRELMGAVVRLRVAIGKRGAGALLVEPEGRPAKA